MRGQGSVGVIHPTAIISSEATLDPSVRVGPFVVIEGAVEIAANTRIDSHSVIKGPCRIGQENHIFSHVVLGEIPQDLKFHGEYSILEIGDRNQIREFSSIHRGTEGGGVPPISVQIPSLWPMHILRTIVTLVIMSFLQTRHPLRGMSRLGITQFWVDLLWPINFAELVRTPLLGDSASYRKTSPLL